MTPRSIVWMDADTKKDIQDYIRMMLTVVVSDELKELIHVDANTAPLMGVKSFKMKLKITIFLEGLRSYHVGFIY